tara:strand:+ start:275 stop:1345 length:1071 start_codon:yes stop_codon:yes gene_type:complete
MKIIIGGAGIAGLSLANFFEQNSIDYLILEKRNLLDDLATGIQIAPNSHYVLKKLNVFKDIKHVSKSSSELFLYDDAAKYINSLDVTNDKGEAPLFLERNALIKALKNKIPEDKILSNVDVNKIIYSRNKLKLETNDKKFECNYFFNSFGHHDSRTFTESSAFAIWGISSYEHEIFQKLNLFMNHNFHLVTYPLKNKGTAFTISVSKDIERVILNDKFNKSFFHKLPVCLKNLLLYSKDPIVRKIKYSKTINWGKFNQINLGDAAHLMLPHLAQGASQAFIDADIVSQLFQQHSCDEIRKILCTRNKFLNRIIHNAEMNRIIFQLNPILSSFRNTFLKLYRPRYKWLYNSDHEIKR